MALEERNNYKTRVVGTGLKLNLVRTPDGILHIDVFRQPSCRWELEGGSFFCAHNETEVVELVDNYMNFDGPQEREYLRYVCAECGTLLDGSPEEDYEDSRAEEELMRALDEA